MAIGDVSVLKGNKNIFNNVISTTWNWGDGNTTMNVNEPQYTYSSANTYDISLSIVYTDNIVAKSFSMDEVIPGYVSMETVVETKIIEGTMDELNAVNATNITLHLDDSNYSVTLDTLFFRGDYEETYYLAHYETTCTSTETKNGFITILPVTSLNNDNSYKYSFESSNLDDDFMVIENELVVDWDFNLSANPIWEVVNGISSDGYSSIMLNGKKLTSSNSVIFETQSYNLSNLTNPAISIDFIGAAVNSFPYNSLTVSYSDECGVWKNLKTISPSKLASAGYYSESFIPNADMNWNTEIMYDQVGSNDLKSPNVRFKFEYSVSSLVNRLYIDNIRIGEVSDLNLSNDLISEYRLSVFPNPATQKTNILFQSIDVGNLDVKLFNVLGNEVFNISDNKVIVGYNSFELNLDNIVEGIYFVSVIKEGVVIETKKLFVQK